MTLDELRKTIDTVVDYNWSAELEGFHDRQLDGEDNDMHIFHHLLALTNLIEGTSLTVEDVIRANYPDVLPKEETR